MTFGLLINCCRKNIAAKCPEQTTRRTAEHDNLTTAENSLTFAPTEKLLFMGNGSWVYPVLSEADNLH